MDEDSSMKLLIVSVLSMSLMAAPVVAKPPLREVAEIDDALFDLGVAHRIRKKCSTISARMLTALAYINNLERKALDMGYTKKEIDAYTDSDADKDRLKAKARIFFRNRGVDTSDPESYCAVGLEEIQKASRIGSLLRAK